MADKLIVAVFSNVNAAYDAAKAINELKDTPGTKFKVKSGIIATKDDQGEVSVLETKSGHLFHGTKVGAVVGGVVALIGGAPMVAVAALMGATVGVVRDAGMAIVKSTTLTSVKKAMKPGTTAVIFEAFEPSPTEVDDIVARGGGHVFRESAASF